MPQSDKIPTTELDICEALRIALRKRCARIEESFFELFIQSKLAVARNLGKETITRGTINRWAILYDEQEERRGAWNSPHKPPSDQ